MHFSVRYHVFMIMSDHLDSYSCITRHCQLFRACFCLLPFLVNAFHFPLRQSQTQGEDNFAAQDQTILVVTAIKKSNNYWTEEVNWKRKVLGRHKTKYDFSRRLALL